MDEQVFLILALVAAVLTLTAAAKLLLSARSTGRTDGMESTDFLDGSGGTCGICMGDLCGDIAECGCGMRFHDGCAAATLSCPYCGAGYDRFAICESQGTVCPECGSVVHGNRCGCGASFPEDGIFKCICGTVLSDDMICERCGCRYTLRRT